MTAGYTWWYVIPAVDFHRVHAADRAAGARKKVPAGYKSYRHRRAIGFASWDATPDWEVVRDDETFSDQADRLRDILVLPDDDDVQM